MARQPTPRGRRLLAGGLSAVIGLLLSLTAAAAPAQAGPLFAAPLCGEGSAPDYGFTYERQQPHWTVDWRAHVAEQTVAEVDRVLDELNEDSIAQTMILFQTPAQVGNRVNCAVHFLRYMQLGQPQGERQDNGFVFLIVVEPARIDVHYGVGLGLPALTASALTSLNRAAEDTYQTTQSLDQALLTLVQGFDTVARSQYAPLASPAPTSETPTQPTGPLGLLSICGQLCMGMLLVLFLLWGMMQRTRGGWLPFPSSGWGSRGGGFPLGGSGGGRPPPMRGGGGGGRSGRGN